ncbi:MAG TPA: DNA alkylation repair protein [Thermoanaerobaculia bacterium]|nr:DNA alkylation repair protein [Thermoanaerobaculia bacterium]
MRKLRSDLLRELRAVADPARAAGAQAYMKSEMPFIGVAATPLRSACRSVFKRHPFEDPKAWRDAVLSLWREAKYREERYAAIELSGSRPYREWQTLATLPMYEEMIVTGAWWDYVDVLAIHRVGEYLLRDHPAKMQKTMRRWSSDRDMWKRRTSILCQITFKADTDLDLLYDCIRPSLASREFFLRKAIGWALRQYAWTDPAEVKRYVREHEKELSPLSRREALKNV